ncbi:MAG: response regulator [Labilithrix sp.]|nr:response regulator [Labilithrix sp.]
MGVVAKRKRRVSSSPPPSSSGVHSRTPPLALVVDDSSETRELHVQCLSLAGWRVASAADGSEGLGLARDLVPDLLLLEMDLPVLDGWQVARSLKADARTEVIAVIAMTSRPDQAFRVGATLMGCAGAVAKDCSPEELLARAREAIADR